jgi:hypothetical protein
MKLLTNRYGAYLTGDDIADAVVHYGLALARRQELDVVDIPFRNGDGTVGRVQLTIGWLTETVATTTPAMSAGAVDELIEVDTSLSIYDKAESSGVIRARPFSAEEASRLKWDADLTRQI